jgi:curved DNA-binding protein CbpA
MSTRAASASASLRAQQDLVRILFGVRAEEAQYSFADLRGAYLQRIQQLHPDKNHSESRPSRQEFHQVQLAWKKYESFAKRSWRADSSRDANFILFGVGCSFADNEHERQLRIQIMDQAARGWFPGGEIAGAGVPPLSAAAQSATATSLLSDDGWSDTTTPTVKEATPTASLVAHLIPPHRRRT